eukprot:2619260-Amphidinium_carterae.1
MQISGTATIPIFHKHVGSHCSLYLLSMDASLYNTTSSLARSQVWPNLVQVKRNTPQLLTQVDVFEKHAQTDYVKHLDLEPHQVEFQRAILQNGQPKILLQLLGLGFTSKLCNDIIQTPLLTLHDPLLPTSGTLNVLLARQLAILTCRLATTGSLNTN